MSKYWAGPIGHGVGCCIGCCMGSKPQLPVPGRKMSASGCSIDGIPCGGTKLEGEALGIGMPPGGCSSRQGFGLSIDQIGTLFPAEGC